MSELVQYTIFSRFEKHFYISIDNQTAISALSEQLSDISKNKLKQAMQYGSVWLTSNNKKATRLRKVKKILSKGDKLSIYYDEKILFSPIQAAQLISDEGEYSVWNKPSGMFSQGTKWGDHSSIARWVELFGFGGNNLKIRPTYLVHRLDRATSGIILLAHSKKIVARLTSLFESRRIEKHYEAIVEGEFPLDLVAKQITDKIEGKSALSTVLSAKYNQSENQSVLVVRIDTGRKHQIRQHLSDLGFPIIGDRLYGKLSTKSLTGDQPDLMLKSFYLSFDCPMTQVKREYKI